MTDSLDDTAFAKGQQADSNDLGDPRDPSKSYEPNWIPEFKKQIDSVILITEDSVQRINERVQRAENILGINTEQASVQQIIAFDGAVRPEPYKGYEQSVVYSCRWLRP